VWQLRHLPATPPSPTALAALVGGVVFALACLVGDPAAEPARDPGGSLTAGQVRACLERQPTDRDLLFRTTDRTSEHFVGVVMMDRAGRQTSTAFVGIAVYADADMLDAYAERAREDPTDEVTRVLNAVVSYHGPSSGTLAVGRRWVGRCLRSG
jgi:hypothetical protein